MSAFLDNTQINYVFFLPLLPRSFCLEKGGAQQKEENLLFISLFLCKAFFLLEEGDEVQKGRLERLCSGQIVLHLQIL